MKEHTENTLPHVADPIIRQNHHISIVWLIPVIALLIGGWLAYKAITEKGPLITIAFTTAEGLEAGKTKVKYKSVDVGMVEKIEIGEDFSQVTLQVQMDKGAGDYLTDQTKFWVVRAQVSASEISGLSTLFSGAYIGIAPSTEGKPRKHFIGLEAAPLVTNTSKGKHFFLLAPRLGSLTPGSPVYFRQIKVGQIINYKVDDSGKNVGVNIFIDTPYDQFVRENTSFWISSGFDIQLTTEGIKVDTESVVSLVMGGIAFGTFFDTDTPQQPAAAENTTFTLYETRDKARNEQFRMDESYYVEFFESTRGLRIGAPVEFMGMQIGVVTDIHLRMKTDNVHFSTMVGIAIEPERLHLSEQTRIEYNEQIDQMIKNGLRAQLRVGHLLTGKLLVELAYLPDLPIQHEQYNGLRVIPSIQSTKQELLGGLTHFIQRLQQLPLEDLTASLDRSLAGIDQLVNSPELNQLIGSLQKIFTNLERATAQIDAETLPEVRATLQELNMLTKELKGWISADSPMQQNLLQSLEQISKAAQSVNNLTDMLERHPEALIQGKSSKEY